MIRILDIESYSPTYHTVDAAVLDAVRKIPSELPTIEPATLQTPRLPNKADCVRPDI